MRILHASELYAPSVGGAQEVVRQVSERLAARGHEVTVATTRLAERDGVEEIAGVRIAEFAVSGNRMRGLEGEVERYRSFVREGGFDVAMTYAAQQWTTDALLDIVGDLPVPTVLAPCGFAGLRQSAYRDYFARMPAWLHGFDKVVFHSATYQDAVFARERSGFQEPTVIPNGADEREFGALGTKEGLAFRARYGIAPDAPLLLTVGGHTGYKGHGLTLAAFLRARLESGATLVIVGNQPTGAGCAVSCRRRAQMVELLSRGRKRVLLLDPPRPEVVDAYAAADLFLFASQIECSPIVLFEAMAARTPFVTVNVGNAGEIVAWGGGGSVVPSRRARDGRVRAGAGRLAGEVERLFADAPRHEALAVAGRTAWAERFTWDAVASQWEALYEELAR